ncbi:hypothetical protein EJA70_06085 [Pseudomonas sp. PB103]|nr:hypothetical protein EJA70_06085 [Pseudomonas sp. PB103]
MEGAVMIRADSFLLHKKSKTPPKKTGFSPCLGGLRRLRTLSQLKKYTSHPPGHPCRSCRRLRSLLLKIQDQKIAAFGSSYIEELRRSAAWAQMTRRR